MASSSNKMSNIEERHTNRFFLVGPVTWTVANDAIWCGSQVLSRRSAESDQQTLRPEHERSRLKLFLDLPALARAAR